MRGRSALMDSHVICSEVLFFTTVRGSADSLSESCF